MSEADRSGGCSQRPLGAFGERVSALGLGLGPLARAGADAPWEDTLAAALDLGVTTIDAAGGGLRRASEERLGPLLLGRRDDVFLSTRSAAREDGERPTPKSVRASLEESLRLLRTDRVDLYHVHDAADSAPGQLVQATLPALVEARERGDVRYVGVSTGRLDVLLDTLHAFPVDALLCYGKLDLVDASLAAEVLPAAAERGVAVVNASPLHSGALAAATPLRDAALDRARADGADLVRAALQFAAGFASVSTTLVGMASPLEVERVVRDFHAVPDGAEARLIAARGAAS
ncbi:MAG: aldo/keto reductase [Planctomycetota bacterium]